MIMLLGLSVAAKADVLPIDDFESYFSNGELASSWDSDNSSTNSTSSVQIVAGEGSDQAMQITANYVDGDYSGVTTAQFTPYVAVAGGALHLSVKLEEGADWSQLNEMIVWQGGVTCDGQGGVKDWAQTWIVGDQSSSGWWMDPAIVPATIGLPGLFSTNNMTHSTSFDAAPRLSVDNGWVDIIIPDTAVVGWSDVSAMSQFEVPVGQLAIQFWGTSGQTFVADVDNIYYVTPEPTTICLLGLGGLALLRKRRA